MFLIYGLTGCASYKITLRDVNGSSITCEASGKSGIITGYYLKKGFEDCVTNAREQGYK